MRAVGIVVEADLQRDHALRRPGRPSARSSASSSPRSAAAGRTCRPSTSFELEAAAERVGRRPFAARPSRCAAADTRSRSCTSCRSRLALPAADDRRTCRRAAGSRRGRCPSPSPSIEIMIVPSARQCTVCGAVRFVLSAISLAARSPCAASAARGSAVSTMWMRLDCKPGHDQVAARLAGVAVATAAGVPAEVVQLVADVGHRQAVDHLASRSATPDRRRPWPGSRASCTPVPTYRAVV